VYYYRQQLLLFLFFYSLHSTYILACNAHSILKHCLPVILPYLTIALSGLPAQVAARLRVCRGGVGASECHHRLLQRWQGRGRHEEQPGQWATGVQGSRIAGQCAGQAGAAPRRRAHQILPSRHLWRGHFAPRDPTGVCNRLSRRALLMSDLEPEVPPPMRICNGISVRVAGS